MARRHLSAASAALALLAAGAAADAPPPKPEGALRVATFNAALSRRHPGALVQDLRLGGSAQIEAVVEIVQQVRPDILLVNEIDHDRRGVAARLFRDALASGRGGADGIAYPHILARPVNSGEASGMDLDRDGALGGPRDAYGYGWFPGQYAMAILSRLPFDKTGFRSFRELLWAEMPDNLLPAAHFGADAARLRLSSKSHWDAPVIRPDGRRLHLLASHPTPPVFDGPEDANGRRNHDEIRFWADYAGGQDWMTDDSGRKGGLPAGADFVVLGDLNLDPRWGAGRRDALYRLFDLTRDPRPVSAGARAAAIAEGGANDRHPGDPGLDTADWPGEGPGNLRVDYVLPSRGLETLAAGVFWPPPDSPLSRLTGAGERISSDHRLVWVDLR